MAGKQGFAAMNKKDQRKIASEGGRASGGQNLKNVDKSKAGKMGARAQSTEAKAKGGRNSHSSE